MKTKKLLGIFYIASLLIACLSLSSCGSPGPEFKDVKQYESGEWEPGWYYEGMSPEEVKAYIDGMTDTQAKQLAVKFFKEKFVFAPPTPPTTDGSSIQNPIGTVAVINNRSRDVTINIIELADDINDQELVLLKQKLREGKTAQDIYVSWYIVKKKTEFPILPPGKYLAFYRNGNNLVIREEILSIDLKVDVFNGMNVSGIVTADR
jgi:hypothetical protein